jgi:hypothetical protein
MKPQAIVLLVLACVVAVVVQLGFGLLVAHTLLQPAAPLAPVFAPVAVNVNGFDFVMGEAPVPFAAGQQGQAATPQELEVARGPMVPIRDYAIRGPFTHGNMAVYLIHGPDKLQGQRVLPLHAALGQNLAVVHEGLTRIDNRSNLPVFIQAGDIVKGGCQDRVVPYDQIVPAGTHQLHLSLFCVEAGRSSPRGMEVSTSFESSSERLPGKNLHLAARYRHSQAEVWAGVQQTQQALARNLGGSVQAPLSQTSLQLTLENERVQRALQGYVDKLLPLAYRDQDVIGYAVAINGEIQAADIYASSALFQDLWPRLLKSSAVAALAEQRPDAPASMPATEVVREFLNATEGGENCQQERSNSTLVLRQESARHLLYDTCDPSRQNLVLHRSFLVK